MLVTYQYFYVTDLYVKSYRPLFTVTKVICVIQRTLTLNTHFICSGQQGETDFRIGSCPHCPPLQLTLLVGLKYAGLCLVLPL